MHNVFYRTKALLPGPSVPTKYQRRPTQPHDIAKMDLRPPKLKLSLDVAETNAECDAEVAAEKQNKSDRYPKNHTTYVDLVSQLRNPTAAETMETWMTTGRKVSLPIGARRPKSESQPLSMCVFISHPLSQSNHTLVLSQSSRTAFFLPSFLGTNSTSNGSDPSNNPP